MTYIEAYKEIKNKHNKRHLCNSFINENFTRCLWNEIFVNTIMEVSNRIYKQKEKIKANWIMFNNK